MLNETLPGALLHNPISKQVFDYRGLEVEERIYSWDKPNSYKLMWSLYPFETNVKDGILNPVCSNDFVVTGDYYPGAHPVATTRDRVKAEFDAYWFDSKGKQVNRNIDQYQEWIKQNASA